MSSPIGASGGARGLKTLVIEAGTYPGKSTPANALLAPYSKVTNSGKVTYDGRGSRAIIVGGTSVHWGGRDLAPVSRRSAHAHEIRCLGGLANRLRHARALSVQIRTATGVSRPRCQYTLHAQSDCARAHQRWYGKHVLKYNPPSSYHSPSFRWLELLHPHRGRRRRHRSRQREYEWSVGHRRNP